MERDQFESGSDALPNSKYVLLSRDRRTWLGLARVKRFCHMHASSLLKNNARYLAKFQTSPEAGLPPELGPIFNRLSKDAYLLETQSPDDPPQTFCFFCEIFQKSGQTGSPG